MMIDELISFIGDDDTSLQYRDLDKEDDWSLYDRFTRDYWISKLRDSKERLKHLDKVCYRDGYYDYFFLDDDPSVLIKILYDCIQGMDFWFILSQDKNLLLDYANKDINLFRLEQSRQR